VSAPASACQPSLEHLAKQQLFLEWGKDDGRDPYEDPLEQQGTVLGKLRERVLLRANACHVPIVPNYIAVKEQHRRAQDQPTEPAECDVAGSVKKAEAQLVKMRSLEQAKRNENSPDDERIGD
jgi:hypothetical protein